MIILKRIFLGIAIILNIWEFIRVLKHGYKAIRSTKWQHLEKLDIEILLVMIIFEILGFLIKI